VRRNENSGGAGRSGKVAFTKSAAPHRKENAEAERCETIGSSKEEPLTKTVAFRSALFPRLFSRVKPRGMRKHVRTNPLFENKIAGNYSRSSSRNQAVIPDARKRDPESRTTFASFSL
jgi:hypothetical protein